MNTQYIPHLVLVNFHFGQCDVEAHDVASADTRTLSIDICIYIFLKLYLRVHCTNRNSSIQTSMLH